jgi:hypothetical protein
VEPSEIFPSEKFRYQGAQRKDGTEGIEVEAKCGTL